MKMDRSDAVMLSHYLRCCSRHIHTGLISEHDWEINRLAYLRSHRTHFLEFLQKLSSQAQLAPNRSRNSVVYEWPPSIPVLLLLFARSVPNLCFTNVYIGNSFYITSVEALE